MFPKLCGVVILLAVGVVVCQAAPEDRGVFDIDSIIIKKGADCDHLGNQHNITFGTKNYFDKLLYVDSVSLKSKLWRINTVDVTYPKDGTQPQGTINYIELTDSRQDGTGGCAYLSNGGVGQKSVTIHFKTQRNHGLDFDVKIYGK